MATRRGDRRFLGNVGRVIGIAGAVWVGYSTLSLTTAFFGYANYPYARTLSLLVVGFVIALTGFSLESAASPADPGGGEGRSGVRGPRSPEPTDEDPAGDPDRDSGA